MKISPLDGPFGTAVEGLDIAQLNNAEIVALMDLLFEHQILVVRGQSLDKAPFVDFGRRWGEPIAFFARQTLKSDYPDLIHVDNDPDLPAEKRNGAQHWHSDSTFDAVPALVTMLLGVETPVTGGETLVASSRMAYAALPASERARLDGLIAIHKLSGAPRLPGETFVAKHEEHPEMGVHARPLVAEHPATGVRALAPSGSAYAIKGMDDAEGTALLRSVREHITGPDFVTRYKIQPGEILLWDNFQTMHSATPIEYSRAEGKRRLLYRISTKGVPASWRAARGWPSAA